jgi:hypothetical protein
VRLTARLARLVAKVTSAIAAVKTLEVASASIADRITWLK